MNVSVLILTLNEEINLDDCLKSLAWSDDVVVYDSLSTDGTQEIARARGARVVERRFDDWSSHQNWAVQNICFRYPWVLYFDADERCTADLRDEVLLRALPQSTEAAFRVRRKDYLMGRWIKHAQIYPTWLIRLFRPEKIHYERLVNPIAIVDGQIGELKGNIIHYPYSHGISHWVARHNRYSDMEAREALKNQRGPIRVRGLLSGDPNDRRATLKSLFFRMPARPVIRFFYAYVWRRGFLDGRAGLIYSILISFYEFLIVFKTRELKRKEKGLPF